MAAPSFDLLILSRHKILAEAGASATQRKVNQVRLRLIQQIFNGRRLTYRNRVEANRQNLILSTIEHAHRREEATQRIQKHNVLTDLKQNRPVVDSSFALLPTYKPIDLTEPKDFYRFGVRVHSAAPHVRSREPGTRSDLARSSRDKNQSRAKSASTASRPFTAPLHIYNSQYNDQEDTESDDEAEPVTISRVTSAKISNDRSISAVSSSLFTAESPDFFENLKKSSSIAPTNSHRVTWPVRIKVFALQDEDEARQQFFAWRAEQRKTKPRRSSKQLFDLDLEKKYQESQRRRKEIEAFVTPELIEEHQLNDPVFAKRYRQLKLAVRAGKTPVYDPADREIHITMNKAKIERARTALITAKQTKIKNFYQDQQKMNDAQLKKRIDSFIKRLTKLKQEQEQEQIDV